MTSTTWDIWKKHIFKKKINDHDSKNKTHENYEKVH